MRLIGHIIRKSIDSITSIPGDVQFSKFNSTTKQSHMVKRQNNNCKSCNMKTLCRKEKKKLHHDNFWKSKIQQHIGEHN